MLLTPRTPIALKRQMNHKFTTEEHLRIICLHTNYVTMLSSDSIPDPVRQFGC
jgi:hypothetical protein